LNEEKCTKSIIMVNRTEGVNSKEPAIRGRYTIDIQFFRVFRVFNKILKRLNKICIIE